MTVDVGYRVPVGLADIRTSTAEKERAIDVLKSGFAEGRLTKDEYDERVDQVYSSRTHGEMAAMTADLPAEPLDAVRAEPPLAGNPAPAALRPSTNRLAIASLVCACIPGLSCFAPLGLGLAARSQIRQRGGNGIGMANTGIAIGAIFWLLAIVYGLTHI